MRKLFNLIQKAQTSKIALWLLNYVMNQAVPFNKPHRFKVISVTPDCAQTFAPYHKKNFNHVRGIHACSIATVGELAAGLILMANFSPKEYRVIMSRIEIDYHYQAKKDIVATAKLNTADKEDILQALTKDNKTTQMVITKINDKDNTPIATVKTTWQIKKWGDVKTKL